jgi:pSer/pThr/pTyr-binding forkhead associated (FHA) protein
MIVKLIVIKGQDDGKIFTVAPRRSKIIGRSSKTDVALHDVGVSRLHCEVRNHGDYAVVVASRNWKAGNTYDWRVSDRMDPNSVANTLRGAFSVVE